MSGLSVDWKVEPKSGYNEFIASASFDLSYRESKHIDIYHGEWKHWWDLFNVDVKANLDIDADVDGWILFDDVSFNFIWEVPPDIDEEEEIYDYLQGFILNPLDIIPDKMTITSVVELHFESTFNFGFDCTGQLAKEYVKTLFEYWSPTPIPIGPIVVIPYIYGDIGVDIKASAQGEIDFSPTFTYDASCPIEITFDGLSMPTLDISYSATSDLDWNIEYSADISAEVTSFIHPGIGFLIYGIAGPGIEMGPAIKVADEYDIINDEHHGGVYYGITGQVGLKIPHLGMPINLPFEHWFGPINTWIWGGGYPGMPNNPPSVDFIYNPYFPLEGETVTFTASTSSTDIKSYKWDFGDGNQGNGETTTNQYLSSGNYDVVLLVENNDGLYSSVTKTIKIYPPINLEIISPTTNKPAFVGRPDNPVEFYAKLGIGAQGIGYCFMACLFEINIGGISANFQLYQIDSNNYYYFKITPPTQSSEGAYDLEIILNDWYGVVQDFDIEIDSVIYSTGGNVDVMTVIDRSGSMSGGKIAAAKSASNLFVDLMNLDDMIGVASFGSGGYLNYALNQITSDYIKQQAKNAINSLYASGSTAMGYGLQQGYNQLVNNGNPTHPWSMVLLSDGYHNSGIHPNSVLPSIINQNIRVFTIGLGSSVDQNLLQNIADSTGGEYYYTPGNEELITIYQAIAGVVKSESTVKTEEGIVPVGDTVFETVDIDSSIDTATFTLHWESGTCDLELIRPDSSIVIPSDADVLSYGTGTYYETFTIDDPDDGTWIMEITRTHASSLKYTISVTASSDVTFHLFTDKDDYYVNEPIHIISALSNDGVPITGGNVNVIIERPDASSDMLSLYDDGFHGDGVSSDGVYANYYTNTDLSGSYIINAYADGSLVSETFTREKTKSVQISGMATGGLTVTPTSWDTDIVYGGDYTTHEFSINSLSSIMEYVDITSTDFINDTNIISAENIFFITDSFSIDAGNSESFHATIFVPSDAIPGNYTGDIIITSTVNSIIIPVKLWIGESIYPSVVDFDPDTLNRKSKGKWVTCYIELPEAYDIEDIDISTILLNDVIQAEENPSDIGDYDLDGIPDLMVKFNRKNVIDILETGDAVEIKIFNELIDGTKFEGMDYIKVI